ncbi:outer membrane transport energization protein ExbD (TC 2.C.1.1.1) [Pseudomonas sp. NFIX10]|nr:outer membrane transport energization protein ExbD (TC 2.C.1.1.1) [Pseudomonas sp. NFIX10]SFE73436.1 outer membrane transport energization protein ExbD (TC 2.C.1.1.1) [Pseudomonas sp. NFACC06-1]
MSMGGSQFDADDVMSDINMTPLIDVMLVLLIIFIITLPVINHSVKLELPKADSHAMEKQPDAIDVSITADGQVLWNKEALDDEQLKQRIAVAAVQDPVPNVRLFADKAVRYERVAIVLSAAQGGGLSKIDFVTEAKPATP